MSKNRSQKRLASMPEAAAHYGVSIRTVQRWIANGQLQAYRVGPKLVRVDLDQALPRVGAA